MGEFLRWLFINPLEPTALPRDEPMSAPNPLTTLCQLRKPSMLGRLGRTWINQACRGLAVNCDYMEGLCIFSYLILEYRIMLFGNCAFLSTTKPQRPVHTLRSSLHSNPSNVSVSHISALHVVWADIGLLPREGGTGPAYNDNTELSTL